MSVKLILPSLFLLIFSSACKQNTEFIKKQMLFRVEYREFFKDKITEYRFFDDKTVNTTVLHDPGINNPEFTNFNSIFSQFSDIDYKKVTGIYRQLQTLIYKNTFPWQEKFEDRGDVVRIFCIQEEKPILKTKRDSIPLSKVFIFYTGHMDEYPQVFKDLLELLKECKTKQNVN